MSRPFNSVVVGAALAVLSVFDAGSARVWAQEVRPPAAPKAVTEKEASAEKPAAVVIQRETLRLVDPKQYQIPLQLEPVHLVQLISTVDGVVGAVHFEPGEKVDRQTEGIRLDNTEQQLLMERAKANYMVAQIEVRRAKSQNDAELVELAEAKLQVAKADLDLATLRFDRTSIRAPFAGEVFRVHAVPGQFVRAGEPLAEFGDTSKLKVEIPVDRREAAPEKMIEIRIEETTTQAKIEAVLPLHPRFGALRDLLNSAASAVVVIDNPGGAFQAGQSVFAPLIPRHLVTEVSTSCISNLSDGQRKVQVVRQNVVRDLPIQLLGQVGDDRLFVSGAFTAGDEVIVSASQELPDGTQIRRSSVAAAEARPESKGGEKPAPASSKVGF